MAEQKEVHIVSEEGIKVEYPIGATISIKGKICKVVEDIELSDEDYYDENCIDCILNSKGKGITCRNLACLNTERKDHKDVHFIEDLEV